MKLQQLITTLCGPAGKITIPKSLSHSKFTATCQTFPMVLHYQVIGDSKVEAEAEEPRRISLICSVWKGRSLGAVLKSGRLATNYREGSYQDTDQNLCKRKNSDSVFQILEASNKLDQTEAAMNPKPSPVSD